LREFPLPYRNAFGTGHRPYLALHVTAPTGRHGAVVGLIDSGADATSLPFGYAALMGYQPDQLEKREAGQAAGTMDIWVARVPCEAFVIGLPDVVFDLWPCFVDGGRSVLWGRRDFFRTFGVVFEESARTFALRAPEPQPRADTRGEQ
jgi:hypothetical protein